MDLGADRLALFGLSFVQISGPLQALPEPCRRPQRCFHAHCRVCRYAAALLDDIDDSRVGDTQGLSARGVMFMGTSKATTMTLVVVYRARLRLTGLVFASDARLFPLTEQSIFQEKNQLSFAKPSPIR